MDYNEKILKKHISKELKKYGVKTTPSRISIISSTERRKRKNMGYSIFVKFSYRELLDYYSKRNGEPSITSGNCHMDGDEYELELKRLNRKNIFKQLLD